MSLFVDSLGISFDFSLNGLFELQWLSLKLRANLLTNLQILALIEREKRASPFPLQLSLTLVLRLIEETS